MADRNQNQNQNQNPNQNVNPNQGMNAGRGNYGQPTQWPGGDYGTGGGGFETMGPNVGPGQRQGQGHGQRFGNQPNRNSQGGGYRPSRNWQQGGNPTPAYPGFGPTTGYGRQMSGYLRGNRNWQAGPHTGKGPRRSDARLQDEVCQRLTQHGQLDASHVDVTVTNGEVTLSGTVDSRQAKRTAEHVADAVPGVQDVHNNLTIQQGQAQSGASAQPAQAGGPRSGGRGTRAKNQQAGLPATMEDSPPIVVPGTQSGTAGRQASKKQSGY